MVAGVLLAVGSHTLTKLVFPPDCSAFFATLLLTAVAIVQYRVTRRRLPAILIIPGFLQIAPGFLGTQSVLALLQPDAKPSIHTFFQVMLLSLQLVTGLLIAEAALGWRGPRGSHTRTARAGAP